MVYKLLQKRKTHGGGKPTSLVFFRDGISEGQLEQAVAHEIPAIKGERNSLES